MAVGSSTVLFGTADPDLSRRVEEKLRRDDVRILTAGNSAEFLDLARRAQPDVIVLEDSLETLGGATFLRLLRGPCPESRVILLLPPGTPPDRDSLRHLDPVCLLVSPVPDVDLAKVIASALIVPSGSAPPRPPVVLCVDDDRLFLKSLMRTLRRRNVSVIGYDNPEEALEAIPIHSPMLAFVDVLMPGMNGLDLVSEIREEYGDALPVVLLSGKSSDDEIAEGMRSGARFYLTKPSDPDLILKIADQILGGGPAERHEVPGHA